MQRHVERLMRRVQHMVGVGRTRTPVDDTGAVQTVQVETYSGVHIDKVPMPALFGFSSVPPTGSDVTYAAIAGDHSAPVVMTTGHQDSRPRGGAPGSSRQYDQAGNSLYFDNTGNPVLAASGTFTIKIGGMMAVFSATGLAITGGMVTADGNVIAGFGGAGFKTLLHHTHPTAALGGPSQPTPGT